MDGAADTLQRIQFVTEGWLTKVEVNKYTESIVTDIYELQLDVAIVLSLVSEQPVEPDPECTMVDNLKMKMVDIETRFAELRDMVQHMLKPAKSLKRKASDDTDVDAAVIQDDPKDSEFEASREPEPPSLRRSVSSAALGNASLVPDAGSQWDTYSQPDKHF